MGDGDRHHCPRRAVRSGVNVEIRDSGASPRPVARPSRANDRGGRWRKLSASGSNASRGGQLSVMSPKATPASMKTRSSCDHEHSARGEAGTGNCVHAGRVGRPGIRCVGDAEACPGFATYGLCESGGCSYFQESLSLFQTLCKPPQGLGTDRISSTRKSSSSGVRVKVTLALMRASGEKRSSRSLGARAT